MSKKQISFLSISSVHRFVLSRYYLYLVLALLPGLFFGCYGEFPVYKAVYQFNGDVSDNGFVQSAVMWVLGFFFVYSIALLADLVIFNLIEFWTGQNPMTAQVYKSPDGSKVVVTPSQDGHEVRLDMYQDDDKIGTRQIVRKEDGNFEIYDPETDSLIGEVHRDQGGDLILKRTGEEKTTVLTRESLKRFQEQMALAM